MGHNSTKPNKFVALVTYSVALLCMLLGLFLPLGNTATGAQGILALQLPAAINAVFGTKIHTEYAFTYSCAVQAFGSGKPFDIGALFSLLYVAVTALGLIALVPVIISNRKDSIALTLASIFETLAVIILTPLVLINFASLAGGAKEFMISGALLIAFLGCLVMLIIQCFAYKKNTAVLKFVLALISLVSVFVTVIDFSSVLALEKPISTLAPNSGLPYGMYGTPEHTYFGCDALNLISTGGFPKNSVDKILCIFFLIITALVIINFILDVAGLSLNKRFMLVTGNVARYGVQTLVIVVAIIISFTTNTYSSGLMLYILLALSAIQLSINLARLITYRTHDKVAEQAEEAETEVYVQPAPVAQPVQPIQPVQPVQPIQTVQPVQPVPPVQPIPPVQPVQPAQPVQPSYTRPAEYSKPPVYTETHPDGKIVINIDKDDLIHSRNVKESNVPSPYQQAQQAQQPQPAPQSQQQPQTTYAQHTQPVYVQPVYTQPVYTQPVQPAQPAPQPAESPYYTSNEAANGAKKTYNDAYYYDVGPIYRGPVDDFIRKLSNAEKVEFSQVFIERLKGNLPNVPNYRIGEDNTKFFTSVFIYYARIREMISEGLMNKIYDQCNKMF